MTIEQRLASLEAMLTKFIENQEAIISRPFTAKEAATYLGISLSYLYKLTHREEIAFFKPNGKLIYFRKGDLDAFAYRNRSASQAELERGLGRAA